MPRFYSARNLPVFALIAALFSAGHVHAQCTGTSQGDLLVNDASAMTGDCGLEVVVDDTQKSYVEDTTPSAETTFRARFLFDPNTITIGDPTDKVKIFNLQSLDPSAPFVGLGQLKIRENAGSYEVKGWVRSTNGRTKATSPWVALVDGENVLEVRVTLGVGTGIWEMWVNNDLEASPDYSSPALTNDAYVGVDRIRLGHINNSTASVSGSLYFDDYVSRRSGFIGAPAP